LVDFNDNLSKLSGPSSTCPAVLQTLLLTLDHGAGMSDKIPQHSHCSKCGKAFIGEDRFCSEECRTVSNDTLKKRKRQLIMLYAITLVVLMVALLFMR